MDRPRKVLIATHAKVYQHPHNQAEFLHGYTIKELPTTPTPPAPTAPAPKLRISTPIPNIRKSHKRKYRSPNRITRRDERWAEASTTLFYNNEERLRRAARRSALKAKAEAKKARADAQAKGTNGDADATAVETKATAPDSREDLKVSRRPSKGEISTPALRMRAKGRDLRAETAIAQEEKTEVPGRRVSGGACRDDG